MGTGTRPGTDFVVRVRMARPGDVDDMLVIEQASFSDPWSRYALSSSIALPVLLVRVAEVAPDAASPGRLAAYSIVSRAADEVELLNLAVSDWARGRGIGRKLVAQAEADAAGWGATALFLEVRESNFPARRLYESAGFRQVGRRKAYYRRPSEDALILRRTLDRGTDDRAAAGLPRARGTSE